MELPELLSQPQGNIYGDAVVPAAIRGGGGVEGGPGRDSLHFQEGIPVGIISWPSWLSGFPSSVLFRR